MRITPFFATSYLRCASKAYIGSFRLNLQLLLLELTHHKNTKCQVAQKQPQTHQCINLILIINLYMRLCSRA